MKNIIKYVCLIILLALFTNTYANIKSYKINIKHKNLFVKDFIKNKSKLEETITGKKYLKKIDRIIEKNKKNTKKLVNIYNKIPKIQEKLSNKTTEKSKKQLNIVNYLQSKIGYILYQDDEVAKIKFDINGYK